MPLDGFAGHFDKVLRRMARQGRWVRFHVIFDLELPGHARGKPLLFTLRHRIRE
jgi:hypothetical protein